MRAICTPITDPCYDTRVERVARMAHDLIDNYFREFIGFGRGCHGCHRNKHRQALTSQGWPVATTLSQHRNSDLTRLARHVPFAPAHRLLSSQPISR